MVGTISVYATVDVGDIIRDISNKELLAELASRNLGKLQALVDGLAPLVDHLDELEGLLFRRDIQGALLLLDRLRDLPTDARIAALKKVMREAGRPFA